ncbi:serine hydrolase [Oceanobacillus sp. CFH 90083]|uniref:serine hydrolase n=1 Tax=Oceanobacillus sp. CFH 90083 TaxID=2592336 RepID=UPI00128E8E44|nr:serine hydrolase [Oceanobacillus sp. CFH 90083]
MSLKPLKQAMYSIKPLPPVKVCYLIQSGENQIAFNEQEQLRSASIIKLFILAAAYYEEERGNLDLSKQICIPSSNIAGGAGVIAYLSGKQTYTYQQLLELMIIVSDNTATNELIDFIGLDNIHAFIQKIHCNNTKLERKLMDEEAMKLGLENRTTCYDVMLLLNLFTEQNNILPTYRQDQILTILENQQFNSKLTAFSAYDSTIRTFHKTGELTGAEHDAAIFQTADKLLKAVMLTEGWTNNGEGQQFHQAAGARIYQYLKE